MHAKNVCVGGGQIKVSLHMQGAGGRCWLRWMRCCMMLDELGAA